jgi:hypothetical protein
MEKMLKEWMKILRLQDWNITLERIHPEQIEYDDEFYFIGITRDFGHKTAIIYHDVDLDEESIIHELLHIVFPAPQEDETYEDYERWITEVAENLANEK